MDHQALLDLDFEINDLMERVSMGDGTAQEINFLKNLYQDLGEILKEIQ